MENLLSRSAQMVARTPLTFRRYLASEIRWDWRLNGIRGARGTGKTTLLLQQIKAVHGPAGKAVYLSLDDLYFSAYALFPLIETLRARGMTHFFFDEVHKYPNWAKEVKNLYDNFPDIFITFTGSSVIELNKLDVDLSRRALLYDLQGLSFREYLLLVNVATLPVLSLDDLIQQHTHIALDLSPGFHPLEHFQSYFEIGYYPFFVENRDIFQQRLSQTVQLVVETDLSFIEGINIRQTRKILQLLYIITTSVPFKPNIAKLAERIGIERNTLLKYLHFLEKAAILKFLDAAGKGISLLQKPNKIYLNNTNLMFALAPGHPDIGTLRETFFFNQTSQRYPVHLSPESDFLVDGQFTFEVGGKNKKATQIKGLSNAFLAADQIETGAGNQIPLWLFGLLY